MGEKRLGVGAKWGKKLAKSLMLGSAISIGLVMVEYPKASAQFRIKGSSSQTQTISTWAYLKGKRIVKIAAPSQAISQRRSRIEKNLQKIFSEYNKGQDKKIEIEVKKQTQSNLPEIYINGHYLMTVTQADAKFLGTTPWGMVKILKEELPSAIKKAEEQKKQSLGASQTKKGAIAGVILTTTIFASWGLRRLQKKSYLEDAIEKALDPISSKNQENSERKENQLNNIHQAKKALIPAAQFYLWTGSMLIILKIFPVTIPLHAAIYSVLHTPLIIGGIAIGLYVAGRIIFVAIDRFVESVIGSDALEKVKTEPRRQEQRVNSISEAFKYVVQFGLIGIGIFLILSVSGVSFEFLLAGVGALGIIVGLATRNLIGDSVNGLFFLLEDQFALDDIIVVENLGVGGIVENMTLRITQLRDVKGRLISIPNGQIEAVANYTYLWCRADLKIPVPYDVDIDKALDTVLGVAEEMKNDREWSDIIVEDPNLLGVDDFDEWRAVIRLWIKVKPMKLWDVSREYRRRLMIAFEEADLNLSIPEQKIHFQQSLPLDFSDRILARLQSKQASEYLNKNNNSQKFAPK